MPYYIYTSCNYCMFLPENQGKFLTDVHQDAMLLVNGLLIMSGFSRLLTDDSSSRLDFHFLFVNFLKIKENCNIKK